MTFPPFALVGEGVDTVPSSGFHRPANTRSSDVFPAPFGPVMSRWSPSETSIVTARTRSLCPPPGSGAPTLTPSNEMRRPPPPLAGGWVFFFPKSASLAFAAASCSFLSSSAPASMTRKSCPSRKVYPASSSRFRPRSSTSVKALPHRSMSSSVARNVEMRSPSDAAARTMKGTCTKIDPTSKP